MPWNGRLDIIKEKQVILKAHQQPKVKHKEEIECAKHTKRIRSLCFHPASEKQR